MTSDGGRAERALTAVPNAMTRPFDGCTAAPPPPLHARNGRRALGPNQWRGEGPRSLEQRRRRCSSAHRLSRNDLRRPPEPWRRPNIHLALELLEPRDLVVSSTRCAPGAPGSLYVVEPELAGAADAHAMQLPAVFAAVRAMGGALPRVLVVGGEPASCDGPALSAPVRAAIDRAATLVRELVRARAPGRGVRHRV